MKIISKLVIGFMILMLLMWMALQYIRSQYYLIEGIIDRNFQSIALSENAAGKTMVIYSPGGNVTYAINIARHLSIKKTRLSVFSECFSSCAEYLLPAAEELNFIGTPLIGFHENIFMSHKALLDEGMSDTIDTCYIGRMEVMNDIYAAKNLNKDFWKETENRLNLKQVNIRTSDYECPYTNFFFENKFWLPTSDKLRILWGLEFKGRVCADNFEKCSRRVDRRWPKGTRIVIGDEVYISKGR